MTLNWPLVWVSLRVAGLATAGALVVGLWLGWLLTTREFIGRKATLGVLALLFAMPVVILAWVLLRPVFPWLQVHQNGCIEERLNVAHVFVPGGSSVDRGQNTGRGGYRQQSTGRSPRPPAIRQGLFQEFAHQRIHGAVTLRGMHLGLANQILGKTRGYIACCSHGFCVTNRCVDSPVRAGPRGPCIRIGLPKSARQPRPAHTELSWPYEDFTA